MTDEEIFNMIYELTTNLLQFKSDEELISVVKKHLEIAFGIKGVKYD